MTQVNCGGPVLHVQRGIIQLISANRSNRKKQTIQEIPALRSVTWNAQENSKWWNKNASVAHVKSPMVNTMTAVISDDGRQRDFTLAPIRSVILAVALAVVTTHNATAGNGWPFVRGPNFDGHSAEVNLSDRWPQEGPPVLWVRKLGQGYSAFVAQNDRVYTQAQNMTGQYLYCLAADTGETIWEYRYDWPYEAAGVYPGPRSTPTLFEDKVYFTSPDGLLGCLNQQYGELIWSVDLLNTYGIAGCDFGYACSPTLIDNMVILPVGGEGAGVVAFDAATGTEVWRATDEPASYTPAYPIELNDEPLVVCYMQNCVLIMNRQTGLLRRKIALSHGYDEHSAWPIYQAPLLWLSGPFRAGSYAVDLSDLNDTTKDLTTVWRSKSMSNDVCSSVCVDGHIYGFDIFDIQSKTHRQSRGIFRCMEFATGEERWSVGTGRPRRTSNADEYASDILQSGIIVADNKLIVLNEMGELILLKADSQQCKELARCKVLGGELTWTPPCLNNGRLYIRNQSQAVCVYVGDPDKLPHAATLRAGDLPQRQYYDLAALILAVEPEYAFDIPHDRWLMQWYLTGMAILVVGKLFAIWVCPSTASAARKSAVEFVTVSTLAAAGTTVLGNLTGEFVFTWPVCLFASLEYVAKPSAEEVDREGQKLATFIKRRIPLAAMLATSVAYFLICRRLSLVFEWAFLIGFVGGLPLVWLTNRVVWFSPKKILGKLATSVLSYSCFFAAVAAFLYSRY